MKVSAKSDYAVRALLELAQADDGPVKGERLAQAQEIPLKFLENILIELRHAGIVRSQRGAEGGYWLARTPGEVSIGEVIRAVDGPLASVRGEAPEDLDYDGAAEHLQTVWIAVRASLRSVVDELTLEDVVAGRLPRSREASHRGAGRLVAPLARTRPPARVERGDEGALAAPLRGRDLHGATSAVEAFREDPGLEAPEREPAPVR